MRRDRLKAIGAGAALLSLPFLVAYDGAPALGKQIGYERYTAPAFVIGPSGATFTSGAARTHLTISCSASGALTLLRIGSQSLLAAAKVDTIPLLPGDKFGEVYARGIDSLRILEGTDVTIAVKQ